MLKRRVRDDKRLRRKRRVRKKIFGTNERPRMSVYRSNKNVYAQLIDDNSGKTLVSASNIESDQSDRFAELNKSETAREVGKLLAERAKEQGFERVVFDRNGYLYHGRVAAIADGAREGGLDF